MKPLPKGHYLFTSEAVSEGHPDKVADQISDAVVDNYLAFDKDSHCAIETIDTDNFTMTFGEVASKANINVESVVRNTIRKIGYVKNEFGFTDKCNFVNKLHSQSPDIEMGVDRNKPQDQGAGDQGIMFGYATNETSNYMPLTIDLANLIVKTLADVRKEGTCMKYLRPDAKAQVTIEYDENDKPVRIDTIVVSTQHDEFIKVSNNAKPEMKKAANEAMLDTIRKDVLTEIIPRVIKQVDERTAKLLNDGFIKYLINPTGKFVIGGPFGDSGITGRKIIVDSYGGRGNSGGGAFSGKDASKVDRSASYMLRYIAKNTVAAGVADRILIQSSYAIGVADPISFSVNTYNTSKINKSDTEIAATLREIFNLRPYYIIEKLNLKQPIYSETAAYGHFGRKTETIHKAFTDANRNSKEMNVELFTWEKLDSIDTIRKAFSL